jgi:hypothetical protein
MIGRVARLLRNPARVRTLLRYEADLLRFRLAAAPVASPALPADDRRRALVVALHSFVPSAKEDGLYAKVLQAHGLTPYFLTNEGSIVERYYRVFGFDRFVPFERYMARVGGNELEAAAARLVADARGTSDLVAARYRGVHIGRHALSSLMRRMHAGKLDVTQPDTKRRLVSLFAEAMRAVHASEMLLDDLQPEVVIFNERGYTPFGEIFDTALQRGLNVINYIASHRDDARVWKRYTAETHDSHPHGLAGESWEALKTMPWNAAMEQDLFEELRSLYATGAWFNFQRLQHGKNIKTKGAVAAQLGLDPGKKVAAVFAHIFWDATFFYGDSLFEDYEEWFIRTVETACRNPRVEWLIKLHPVNTWRLEADGHTGELAERVAIERHIGKLPPHVHLLGPDTDINTYSLFEAVDYCLTVRGTIGIEMAIFGVPVFTAGTGRYSGLGFTHDFASPEEYLAAIARIEEYPPLTEAQTELARRHAYGIFKLRPLRLSAFTPQYSSLKNTFHALNGTMRLNVSSLDALVHSPDMVALTEWALRDNAPDYLALPPGASPAHS